MYVFPSGCCVSPMCVLWVPSAALARHALAPMRYIPTFCSICSPQSHTTIIIEVERQRYWCSEEWRNPRHIPVGPSTSSLICRTNGYRKKVVYLTATMMDCTVSQFCRLPPGIDRSHPSCLLERSLRLSPVKAP